MKRSLKKVVVGMMIIAILAFSGCSKKGSNDEIDAGSSVSEETEIHFLEGKSESQNEGADGHEDAGEKILLVWEDNKRDDYYAVIHHQVKKVDADGQIPSGGVIFVGEGGCVRHGNHAFTDYKKKLGRSKWNFDRGRRV